MEKSLKSRESLLESGESLLRLIRIGESIGMFGIPLPMFGSFVDKENDSVLQVAKRLAGKDDLATVFNIYSFVKAIPYGNEKKGKDSWRKPADTLRVRNSAKDIDCEDHAILLASLLSVHAIPNDILSLFIPGFADFHVINAVSLSLPGSGKLLLDSTTARKTAIDVIPYEQHAMVMFIEKSYIQGMYVPLVVFMPLPFYRNIPV